MNVPQPLEKLKIEQKLNDVVLGIPGAILTAHANGKPRIGIMDLDGRALKTEVDREVFAYCQNEGLNPQLEADSTKGRTEDGPTWGIFVDVNKQKALEIAQRLVDIRARQLLINAEITDLEKQLASNEAQIAMAEKAERIKSITGQIPGAIVTAYGKGEMRVGIMDLDGRALKTEVDQEVFAYCQNEGLNPQLEADSTKGRTEDGPTWSIFVDVNMQKALELLK